MKRIALLLVLVTMVGLVALRVFGAYQSERDSAIARAEVAEQVAARLAKEREREDRQMDCNNQWVKYKTKQLQKQIAEYEGRTVRTPVEPECSGYAPTLGDVMEQTSRSLELINQEYAAKTYAQLERHYATNRKLQTRYLGRRLWAFLTGTELEKLGQAKLERDQEATETKVAHSSVN